MFPTRDVNPWLAHWDEETRRRRPHNPHRSLEHLTMTKWKGTALVLAALCVSPRVGHAQAADSTRKFSLFGAATMTDYNSQASPFSEPGGGGSIDFRTKSFPLTLRTTLAFSQASANFARSAEQYGTFSLDAVTRPGRGFFGIRPYLLGGMGVATRADYVYYASRGSAVIDPTVPFLDQVYSIRQPRANWAYMEGGAGLEFGKFFLEGKIQHAAA